MNIWKSRAETYTIKPKQGWGIITLNAFTGTVDCQSDYGDYCHRWTSIGNSTLKEFICKIDFQYAMRKLAGKEDHFDFYRTIIHMKRDVINLRKEGSLEKDEAAGIWKELKNLSHSDSSDEFYSNLEETIVQEIWPEFYEYFYYDFQPQAYFFWIYIWLPFIDRIKKEIKDKVA